MRYSFLLLLFVGLLGSFSATAIPPNFTTGEPIPIGNVEGLTITANVRYIQTGFVRYWEALGGNVQGMMQLGQPELRSGGTGDNTEYYLVMTRYHAESGQSILSAVTLTEKDGVLYLQPKSFYQTCVSTNCRSCELKRNTDGTLHGCSCSPEEQVESPGSCEHTISTGGRETDLDIFLLSSLGFR